MARAHTFIGLVDGWIDGWMTAEEEEDEKNVKEKCQFVSIGYSHYCFICETYYSYITTRYEYWCVYLYIYIYIIVIQSIADFRRQYRAHIEN